MSQPESPGAVPHLEPIAPIAARFVSGEREQQYRDWSSASDVRRARLIVLASVPPMALFVLSDFHLFGLSPTFLALLAGRVAFVAYSLMVVATVRADTSQRRRDVAYTVWLISMITLAMGVNLTRPAAYTGHIAVDVLMLLLVCVVTPLSFPAIAICTALFSAMELGVLYFARVWSSPVAPALWLGALVQANIIGLWTVNRLNHAARRRFDAWGQQRALRRRLTEAQEHLRLLEGIIPVCWECGLVRDSDGCWTAVAEYVDKGTDERFGESACLCCQRAHEARG